MLAPQEGTIHRRDLLPEAPNAALIWVLQDYKFVFKPVFLGFTFLIVSAFGRTDFFFKFKLCILSWSIVD